MLTLVRCVSTAIITLTICCKLCYATLIQYKIVLCCCKAKLLTMCKVAYWCCGCKLALQLQEYCKHVITGTLARLSVLSGRPVTL